MATSFSSRIQTLFNTPHAPDNNTSRQPLLAWLPCLLCIMLLCLPSLLVGMASVKIRWSDDAGLSILFWLLWLTLWGRMGFALIFALPFVLIWPVEMWLRLYYGSTLSVNFVALAFETNLAELSNFFSALGWWLCLPLAWLLLYTCSVWSAFHYSLRWQGRMRWFVMGSSIVLIGFFFLSLNDRGWTEDVNDRLQVEGGISAQLQAVYPLNVIVSTHLYQIEGSSMAALHARMQRYHFGAHVQNPEHAAQTVVLIIGESSTAQRWSLLGYKRKTNPLLEKLELALFGNVSSVATSTRVAVPAAISPRPVLTHDGKLDEDAQPSLLKAFAEAGYDTWWLSNQAAMGPYDSSIGIYAAEARHIKFLNPSSYSARGSLDEVLLPALDEALAKKGGKPKLIVLHTMGSHFDQALRYPASFAHFRPVAGDTEKEEGIASREQQEDNAYDNSVRYTDWIIAEVIRRTNALGQRSVVAFFSEHGVDAHRTPCSPRSSIARATRASLHVPILFWFSDEYKESNPTILPRLQAHRDLPYSSVTMFASLLEISGLALQSPRLETLESLFRVPGKAPSSRKLAPNAFENSCEKLPGN